jgi:hypothetical protein
MSAFGGLTVNKRWACKKRNNHAVFLIELFPRKWPGKHGGIPAFALRAAPLWQTALAELDQSRIPLSVWQIA